MKHLLNSVAIAVTTALVMPALAQMAPMTPSKAAPMTPSTMATNPMHPMAMPMHHRRHRYWGESERMAEQLNAQELQRIRSGAPPSTPAPMPMPSNYETPGKPVPPGAPGTMAPASISNYQTPGQPVAPGAAAPVPPSNYQTPGK